MHLRSFTITHACAILIIHNHPISPLSLSLSLSLFLSFFQLTLSVHLIFFFKLALTLV